MIPPSGTIRAQESRDSKAGVSSGSGSILGDNEFHDGIMEEYIENISGWWFGTFVIFHNIWDNPSHWLSYFSRWLLHHQAVLNIDRWVIDWDPLVWIKHRQTSQMCTLQVFNVDPFCLMIFSWGLNVAQLPTSTAMHYADFWLPWPCSHFANVEPCPANLIWRASESQTSIGRTQSTQWFSRQACYRFGMFWLCQTELSGRSAHGRMGLRMGELCIEKNIRNNIPRNI